MQHLAWRGLLDGRLKVRPMTLPDRLSTTTASRSSTRRRAQRAAHRRGGAGGARQRRHFVEAVAGPDNLIPDLFRSRTDEQGTLPANLSMLTSLIGRIVAASARHPLIVLLLAVALTAMALVYSSRHFAMTADTAELISTKHEWRQESWHTKRLSRRFRSSPSW